MSTQLDDPKKNKGASFRRATGTALASALAFTGIAGVVGALPGHGARPAAAATYEARTVVRRAEENTETETLTESNDDVVTAEEQAPAEPPAPEREPEPAPTPEPAPAPTPAPAESPAPAAAPQQQTVLRDPLQLVGPEASASPRTSWGIQLDAAQRTIERDAVILEISGTVQPGTTDSAQLHVYQGQTRLRTNFDGTRAGDFTLTVDTSELALQPGPNVLEVRQVSPWEHTIYATAEFILFLAPGLDSLQVPDSVQVGDDLEVVAGVRPGSDRVDLTFTLTDADGYETEALVGFDEGVENNDVVYFAAMFDTHALAVGEFTVSVSVDDGRPGGPVMTLEGTGVLVAAPPQSGEPGSDNGGSDNGGTDNGGTDNGGADDGGADDGGAEDGGINQPGDSAEVGTPPSSDVSDAPVLARPSEAHLITARVDVVGAPVIGGDAGEGADAVDEADVSDADGVVIAQPEEISGEDGDHAGGVEDLPAATGWQGWVAGAVAAGLAGIASGVLWLAGRRKAAAKVKRSR